MLNWSSSAADGHHSHLEYKAGARARPKLSHPAPVKRGAGGLPSFSLTFLHSVFLSQFLNFLICYRSWAFCSWTLLKLLTMLRKVTNLIKKAEIDLCIVADKFRYVIKKILQERGGSTIV